VSEPSRRKWTRNVRKPRLPVRGDRSVSRRRGTRWPGTTRHLPSSGRRRAKDQQRGWQIQVCPTTALMKEARNRNLSTTEPRGRPRKATSWHGLYPSQGRTSFLLSVKQIKVVDDTKLPMTIPNRNLNPHPFLSLQPTILLLRQPKLFFIRKT
jgi:hypothetical protein